MMCVAQVHHLRYFFRLGVFILDISVKEDILDKLRGKRFFHNTSLDQYAMRCPLCGDSRKDPSKTRFYLKINLNDESPIVYNCFNCDSSGILTADVLRSMEIMDRDINARLSKFNKASKKSLYKRLGIKNEKLNVKIPNVTYTLENSAKKKYIESRLGIELTFIELIRLKCIFSLRDFLLANNVERLTVNPERAKRLNSDYVGFLTMQNEYINFRDTTGRNKLRYDKYAILEKMVDAVKMYTIPSKVDVLTTDEITINIAEGMFDVLGIFYNINNKNTKNQIYTAVCGSGYMNVIKHFIRLGFIGKNITIKIFSDSDKDTYFYRKTIEYAKQFVGRVYLIYNTLEKDYGVPKDQIYLKVLKM